MEDRHSKKHGSGEGSPKEGADGHFSGDDGPSQKRSKQLDERFKCPQEGCGKSYSRTEHLRRHRHNHNPMQIYNCGFLGCFRTFVRNDLRLRHEKRHTAKGSQLGHAHVSSTADASPEVKSEAGQQYQSPQEMKPCSHSLAIHLSRPYSDTASSSGGDNFPQSNSFIEYSNSHNITKTHDPSKGTPQSRPQRHSPSGMSDTKPSKFLMPPLQTTTGPDGLLSSASSSQNYNANQHSPQTSVPQETFTPFTLPPPGFSPSVTAASSTRSMELRYPTSVAIDCPIDSTYHQQSSPDRMLPDQMTVLNTMAVFRDESYNCSPFANPEQLVANLFSGQQINNSVPIQIGQQGYANYPNALYVANDISLGGFFLPNGQQPHHPRSVTSLLDTSLPEAVLSEEKSQQIVDLIKERFNETDDAPVARQKEALLEGDRSDESHILSRKMIQTYIGSYWFHFSEQVPILHKPTFSPSETPNLLLIAMMAIGASCLDKIHGYEVTQASAELSNFLAWHLRWEILNDYHSRPPAKLWVFQSLLLLELYEKIYSTRALHERAHVHHTTTITLMRRGSSLLGRSALDSPPSVRHDEQGVNDSTSGANAPDKWWNHWITNEATRRAAFAAFVIDSTHATMFGHSTVMVAHEMRLPLPCDEALWTATNSAEVGRSEASLYAKGVKPISFLEGLKRTLNGQEVRTNSFGRTILMAGLLSVSWHMNQRDLQVNSLGVSQAPGGRDIWRGTLTRAFDLWKLDFDRSLNVHIDRGDNIASQSMTVLHHLAHMATHVDIIDCQIFAGAERLMGRTIVRQDLKSAQRRMKERWAPTAQARDATWYALRLLCSVLLPEQVVTSNHTQSGYNDPPFDYSARDDALLNRPWAMYFAALIVWCYGYALEGPITAQTPATYDFEDQVRDMRAYLRWVGSVLDPEKLKSTRGFNGCSGMLMVLRTLFKNSRWELLHEAALLLENCIHLLNQTG